jgi:hypothetical protein
MTHRVEHECQKVIVGMTQLLVQDWLLGISSILFLLSIFMLMAMIPNYAEYFSFG